MWEVGGQAKATKVVNLQGPNALHHAFAIQAAEAGKHVIVEKPLTGYFGEPGDPEPIGDRVPRAKIQSGARKNVAAVLEAVRRNRVTLGYAENWVYAPPVEKLRRLIQVSGGAILDLRAEENHSGSHSPYSRHWRHTGGGTLLRMGVHPVGAVLHLKAFEGQVRHGRPIRPVSVVADVAPLMRLEAARREQQKWIPADPEDEDWFRGYPQEMRDFVDAIREGRDPLAGLTLAADCIEVIYAAYLSAEEGRRVPLELM